MKTKFQGAKLNSVGAYLSKNLYVYPEQSNGTVVDDEIEVDIENGNYILEMGIQNGSDSWEWYHCVSTKDKKIFEDVTKIAIKQELKNYYQVLITPLKEQLNEIIKNEKKNSFFNIMNCCGSIEECMSETKRLQLEYEDFRQ